MRISRFGHISWVFSCLMVVIALPAEAEEDLKWNASLALRPTWANRSNRFYMENSAALGVSKDHFSLSYGQDFNTNLVDDSHSGEWDPQLVDGYLSMGFSDIYVEKSRDLHFSDVVQVFFPTHKPKRDAGMLFQLRNQFNLSRGLGAGTSMMFSLIPIFHSYQDDGVGSAANPLFETRFIWTTSIALVSHLVLSLPLKFYVTRFHEFQADADLGGNWSYFLGVSPSLNFSLSNALTLGAAFSSGNFMEDGLYGLTSTNGVDTGSFQLSLNLAL